MARKLDGNVYVTGFDVLTRNVEGHDRHIKKVILAHMIRAESESTTYAKQNAPWTDRTGNARAGLFSKARAVNGGESFELIVAHSMSYGLWLEIRFSGKYAIIQPTIDHIGPILMKRIGDTLLKMGVGVE